MKRKAYSLALSSIAISVLALNSVAAEKQASTAIASTTTQANLAEPTKPHKKLADATKPHKKAAEKTADTNKPQVKLAEATKKPHPALANSTPATVKLTEATKKPHVKSTTATTSTVKLAEATKKPPVKLTKTSVTTVKLADATKPSATMTDTQKKPVKVTAAVKQPAKLTEAEATRLGAEAYIYGYPLITMDLTKEVMTNVATPGDGRGPIGQFSHARQYPDATSSDISAPNTDTLYSVAWLDLSKEPYVIHMPEENGRYYSMPMLSGWTDVFEVPGTRTTGTKAHDYAIVGPNWNGTLPKDVIAIKSPTNMVWIMGRTYCDGTSNDYAVVNKLQDAQKIVPLSFYGKDYTPPANTVNPNIDMTTPVRDQVNALDAGTYFKRLAALMKDNPPSKADATIVAKMAKLGIVPGQDFDITKIDPTEVKGLTAAVKLAQEQIMAQVKNAGDVKNGWTYTTKTGLYGTDYLQRAFVAAVGLGANRPQDAIYPTTLEDSTGKKLNGANKYVIHFAKNELPPVRGFWSLTMYDDKYNFIANPLNRYSLNDHHPLKPNKDGSIDIYVQNTSPGKDKDANWLPSPTGDFILMFRFYWPKQALLDGKWNVPAVKKI